MKRILAMILSVLMLAAAMTACGQQVISSGTTETISVPTENSGTNQAEDATITYEPKTTEALLDINDVPEADLNAADAEYQHKAPVKGEEVAVLHTNYGDIHIKFFPEVAPKAVSSFKALAGAGRYDNTIFHRVTSIEKDNIAVVQGGDYTNFNGTGGVSAYGEGFGLEISDYLSNSEGSVAMARSYDPNSNGSQFYINQLNNNSLDGSYTVFGQVFDGMDVVNNIAAVEVDGSNRPVKDVIIESVELYQYK